MESKSNESSFRQPNLASIPKYFADFQENYPISLSVIPFEVISLQHYRRLSDFPPSKHHFRSVLPSAKISSYIS